MTEKCAGAREEVEQLHAAVGTWSSAPTRAPARCSRTSLAGRSATGRAVRALGHRDNEAASAASRRAVQLCKAGITSGCTSYARPSPADAQERGEPVEREGPELLLQRDPVAVAEGERHPAQGAGAALGLERALGGKSMRFLAVADEQRIAAPGQHPGGRLGGGGVGRGTLRSRGIAGTTHTFPCLRRPVGGRLRFRRTRPAGGPAESVEHDGAATFSQLPLMADASARAV